MELVIAFVIEYNELKGQFASRNKRERGGIVENIKDEMNIISIENMTLKTMNEYFVQAQPQCNIIGDLNIDRNGFLHLAERKRALRYTNSEVWRMN